MEVPEVQFSVNGSDVEKLLRDLYEQQTPTVAWSEHPEDMNVAAVKSMQRGAWLLMRSVLEMFGFQSYEEAVARFESDRFRDQSQDLAFPTEFAKTVSHVLGEPKDSQDQNSEGDR